MKNSKLKLMLAIILFTAIIMVSTSIFASNENIQILKKSDAEYMLYIKENLNEIFEFAFSNNKSADKETLTYRNAALDSNEDVANYIAYVDTDLYNQYFNQNTYLWARNKEGKYFVNGVQIDLTQSVLEENVELANTITKTIAVNTKDTMSTEEIVDGAKITKKFGKVDILDNGEFYYKLEKLPSNKNYNRFNEIAKQIANSKVENNIYARLEVAKEFADLYETLKPAEDETTWVKVENKTIIQPEETEDGDEYVLWIKQVNNNETTIDAQFLTCFKEYDQELIKEQIEVKLPVTYDDPTLFIVLGVLVIALVVVYILKKHAKKKEK